MNLKDAGIYDLINIFKGEPTAAHSYSSGGIIGSGTRVINIPAYQRPYRWQPENIQRLFWDYNENRSEYFLGSAVAVEKKRSNDLIELDLVDGQQRITTLFLINYLRYLFKREFTLFQLSKQYQPKSSQYCKDLRDTYVDLIGKNPTPFDRILSKIDELTENETISPDERTEQLIKCYKEELSIPDPKPTPEKTYQEVVSSNKKFFLTEQLCLKYSRNRYDNILRDAICSVWLKPVDATNTFELQIPKLISDSEEQFGDNYLKALSTIFDEVWNEAQKQANESSTRIDICLKAIEYLDEIIKNMSLCVVLTEDENDANKLFEVLNDRALEVEDLELIKNHFYKEYCTKSNDSEEEKDTRISQLEEIWADRVFNNSGIDRNKLVSYLTTVYLTRYSDIGFKDGVKLKNTIDKYYSSKYYTESNYSYSNAVSDFNAFWAVKIILEEANFKFRMQVASALEAEKSPCSITYRALNLLNALKYHSVIPAITNVIISSYCQNHNMSSSNFENDFRKYVKEIMHDKSNSSPEFTQIHRCSYCLWVSAIMSKDYNLPRAIAREIIKKFGFNKYSSERIDLMGEDINNLGVEFDGWLNNWTYGNNKMLVVKVLMLHLLMCTRTDNGSTSTFSVGDLIYTLDASNLQLDHLEANNIINAAREKYYLPDDPEKRQKDVNNYLGNFMILDAEDNNKKNNIPMCQAIAYYDGIKTSWMIEEINNMMNDDKYFDIVNHIPKEEFFSERTKRLKKYFRAFLAMQFNSKQFTVSL